MGSSQRITSLGRELADTVVSEAGKRATYALRGERRCQRCGQALRVARPFCSGCGPAARSHINAFKQQAPRILQAHGPASAEWGQFMAAFWAASGVPITFALAQIPEAVTDWMRRKASFAMADGNGAQPRRDPLQGQGSARR